MLHAFRIFVKRVLHFFSRGLFVRQVVVRFLRFVTLLRNFPSFFFADSCNRIYTVLARFAHFQAFRLFENQADGENAFRGFHLDSRDPGF